MTKRYPSISRLLLKAKDLKKFIDLNSINIEVQEHTNFYIHECHKEQLFKSKKDHRRTIGTVVENLTRLLITKNKDIAFRDCCRGAHLLKDLYLFSLFSRLLEEINFDLTDKTILSVLKIDNFCKSFWNRWTEDKLFEHINLIQPNKELLENIRSMVEFNLEILRDQEIKCDVKFWDIPEEICIASKAGIDFLSSETLYELKVITNEPKEKHWLQSIIYFLLGLFLSYEQFKDIKTISIISSRSTKVYKLNTNEIPETVIESILKDLMKTDDLEAKRIKNYLSTLKTK